ncbi:MAG: uracil-DNA glycosylase [Clostridiaceae bacterium]
MNSMIHIGNSWDEILKEEFEKDYFTKLQEFVAEEYQTKVIYPEFDHIFSAFKETPYEKVKVVILGQDPYHEKGQAHGLAFSVMEGTKLPPSLKNIFKEMKDDLNIKFPSSGCLLPWAKQGVLLLNTVLTVREGKANSHKGKGWERFTDHVIEKLSERKEPVVFILWGNSAISKAKLIKSHHEIISSVHPSPLSANRGFFGSKPFSRTNAILRSLGQEDIDWEIK